MPTDPAPMTVYEVMVCECGACFTDPTVTAICAKCETETNRPVPCSPLADARRAVLAELETEDAIEAASVAIYVAVKGRPMPAGEVNGVEAKSVGTLHVAQVALNAAAAHLAGENPS